MVYPEAVAQRRLRALQVEVTSRCTRRCSVCPRSVFDERWLEGDLSEEHWRTIKFLREDYMEQGTTATLRRVSTVGGIPTKELFVLFPKKPAKKMAYVSGLPKPAGCV